MAVRILLEGLTCGMRMYHAGQVEPNPTAELLGLARAGLAGHRVAEVVPDVPGAPEAPEATRMTEEGQEALRAQLAASRLTEEAGSSRPEPTAETEQPGEVLPVGPVDDLGKAIIDLVRAGESKRRIIETLARSGHTYRQSGERFDQLLSAGVIRAGEQRGQYLAVK